MKCLLTMRIRDGSNNAVYRLSEHILRAQRLAWLSDGVIHPKAGEPRERLIQAHDMRAILELEMLGREVAFERSGYSIDYQATPGLRYTGDVADSTILVNEVESGSLALELAIPLVAFVAIYIARLYAKDRNEERQFNARMRTITAVEEQLQVKSLPDDIRETLLIRMIDGIGAFDSEIIEGLTVEVAGNKLIVGSHTLRGDSAIGASGNDAIVAQQGTAKDSSA